MTGLLGVGIVDVGIVGGADEEAGDRSEIGLVASSILFHSSNL
jgi:hypothetical protein